MYLSPWGHEITVPAGLEKLRGMHRGYQGYTGLSDKTIHIVNAVKVETEVSSGR